MDTTIDSIADTKLKGRNSEGGDGGIKRNINN